MVHKNLTGFYRKKEFVARTQLVSVLIFSGIFLTTLLLFAWGKLILQTSRRENAIEAFVLENQKLKSQQETLLEKIAFLSSEQFKDKWAKERKNLVNSGEKVIILPSTKKVQLSEKFRFFSPAQRQKFVLENLPARSQWWEFFFGEKV